MSDLNLFGASPFDAIRRIDEAGEYWSARDLMPVMGYTNWREFKDAIDRAKVTAANTGADVSSLFGDAPKKLTAGRPAEDFRLARYAAYLVAMNGDPRKAEVAAAQAYFAVKTREAEVRQQFAIPQSYAEALRAHAAEVEAHEATRAELTVVKPQAEAWNTLADTGADYSVREAAYILNRDPSIDTGQMRLFGLLREWRLIGADKRPYATHAKHVTLRPQTRELNGERIPAAPQVRVTVEGLAYLHKRMGGTAPLDTSSLDGAA